MQTIFQPAAKAAIQKAIGLDDPHEATMNQIVTILEQNAKGGGVTWAEFGSNRLNLLIAKVQSVNVPAAVTVDDVQIVMLMSQERL